MQSLHSYYTRCLIVRHTDTAYIPPSTAGASPPPLRPLRSLLVGTCSRSLVAPLSPRAGPHFFCRTCSICMAGIPHTVLPTRSVEFIKGASLRRVPYPPPSEQVSRHRTGIVSSSLDPGSPAERISSSLALCPTFDLASALSSALSSDRAFFCLAGSPQGECNQDFTAALPRAHQAHLENLKWALPFLSAF